MADQQIRVRLRTAFGDEERLFDSQLRIVDVCRMLRVPPGAVALLVASDDGVSRAAGLFSPLGRVVGAGNELILQLDRNVNYSGLLSDAVHDVAGSEEHSADVVGEYIFPSGHYGYVSAVQLTAENCQEFVDEAVRDFVEDHRDLLTSAGEILVGTSGGGDSNALLSALTRATADLPVRIEPLMLLGLPEWDSALERAQALCADLNLPLTVLDSAYVNRAIGRPDQRPDWVGDFRKLFPEDDYDVVGTLAIRRALTREAKRRGTTCIVTGLNLEDILAECFLRLAQGRPPLRFPVRLIDGVNLLYPIHRVPKKILDGCYPRFSLTNYAERSVGTMMGRAVPYYLAQSMNATVPGIEFDLLEGFRNLPHVDPVIDDQLGFAILDADEVSVYVRERWEQYVAYAGPTKS